MAKSREKVQPLNTKSLIQAPEAMVSVRARRVGRSPRVLSTRQWRIPRPPVLSDGEMERFRGTRTPDDGQRSADGKRIGSLPLDAAPVSEEQRARSQFH